MAFDFPNAPTIGQVFNNYTWDGEKWALTSIYNPVDAGAVRFDTAQALTAAQQVQARQNIYVPPFDALSYSGMQINGSFEISQERAVNTGTIVSGSFICDGWRLGVGGTMVVSGQQSNSAFVAGFPNLIALLVGTAQASLGAGDFCMLTQSMEGYRVSRLWWPGGQPITIGFWTANNPAGLYSVAIRNGATNRCYVATYTQNVANAAEYKTITVPADGAGTWATDNTTGMIVAFTMAAGVASTAPTANTWYGANYVAAPGQVNAVATTSGALRITGIVVLPGVEAPSAARSPFIMRPADQELMLCRRYFENGPAPVLFMSGYPTGTTSAYGDIRFGVVKRAVPTITYSGWKYYSGFTATAFTPGNSTNDPSKLVFTGTGLTNWIGWTGDGVWSADARL